MKENFEIEAFEKYFNDLFPSPSDGAIYAKLTMQRDFSAGYKAGKQALNEIEAQYMKEAAAPEITPKMVERGAFALAKLDCMKEKDDSVAAFKLVMTNFDEEKREEYRKQANRCLEAALKEPE